MKIQVLLILSIFACCSFGQLYTSAQAQEKELSSVSINDLMTYNKWKFDHKKSYFNSEEASFRQILFLKNLQKINKHNSNKANTHQVGINQFTDLTQEEFAAIALNPVLNQEPIKRVLQNNEGGNQGSTNSTTGGQTNCEIDKSCQPPPQDPLKEVPQSVDWRLSGKVSPVKNQGGCGSCWAFSAVGLIESVNLLRNNTLAQYSEQELVDCTYKQPAYYNYGCQGGWPSSAHAYMKQNGISLQSNYIYRSARYNCTITPNSPKAFYPGNPIYPWFNNSNRTNLVQWAVSIQPLSVLVDATNWSGYRSGVLSTCGTTINHAVLLVGYTPEGNWIVKNSWGTNWGQQGYIILAPGNTCNILSSPLGSTI